MMVRVRGHKGRRVWAGIALSLPALISCLIAEPPGDLPRVPRRRPVIVQSSLVPPATLVLGTFPEKLIVPVELADPSVSFQWSAFVDFNPKTGQGLVGVDTSTFERANLVEGLRMLEIALPQPPDLDRCHTIEVVVALELLARSPGINAHTPRDPGGDSVTWFYSPTGDPAGCPMLDAGVDASIPPGGPPSADGGPS